MDSLRPRKDCIKKCPFNIHCEGQWLSYCCIIPMTDLSFYSFKLLLTYRTLKPVKPSFCWKLLDYSKSFCVKMKKKKSEHCVSSFSLFFEQMMMFVAPNWFPMPLRCFSFKACRVLCRFPRKDYLVISGSSRDQQCWTNTAQNEKDISSRKRREYYFPMTHAQQQRPLFQIFIFGAMLPIYIHESHSLWFIVQSTEQK